MEKAQKELGQVTLGDKARIAKELADVEFEITRLKRVVAELSDYEAVAGQSNFVRAAVFMIIRGDPNTTGNSIRADETTPVLPGDVIKVDIQREARGFVDN